MNEKINTLLRKIGLKAVEIKLEQVTIDEGAATLEAEVFEAGQPVFIVNEDERIPLPVGEYELDNGFKLVVAEEGIIAEYMEYVEEPEAEQPEQPMPEETAMSESPAESPVAKKIVESVSKETYFSKELHDTMVEEIANLKAEIELLKQPKEEVTEEVELSKPIQHNPESGKAPEVFRYATKGQNPLDNIFARLNN